MSTLVMKLGGAAVATPERFSHCAEIILERAQKFQRVAVVVSAMKGVTDDLIGLAKRVNEQPQPREYDMLISVGERISMALLAMALEGKNHQAVSFTGSQTGIITCSCHANAKIIDVRPHRLIPHLDGKRVVIVAGFQGVSKNGEITTLGRGGSDTTAVALGVALGADKVEFYKDVSGIYAQDPKLYPQTPSFPHLTYQEAIDIVQEGAKVLHQRCIHLARQNALPLHVMSFITAFDETMQKGTLIQDAQKILRPVSPRYEEDHD